METKSLGEIRTEEAFKAVENNDFDKLEWLATSGMADMASFNEQHETMLHTAAKVGNLEIAKYLVERIGLNPMKADIEGRTAWDIAYEKKNEINDYFESIVGCKYEQTFHNPVHRGFFPDPSIIRVQDAFYTVNSSFCFFPCIPISKSFDLVHWEIVGYAIMNEEWSGLDGLNAGMGYWAPDISYSAIDDTFYITATLRMNDDMEKKRFQMVTSSKHVEGPYGKPVFLDIDGIDPSIFHDDDGKKYMLVNRGARLFELSQDCKSIVHDYGLLWYGNNKRKPEGPHLLKKDGYYYIIVAEGGTGRGHSIAVARSKNILGPYENCPYNPILHQYDEEALIQCTGHGKFVQLKDGSWITTYLCLRYPKSGFGIIGRETCIDPVTWTNDGWPLINKGQGPSDQQIAPLPFSTIFENIKVITDIYNWKNQEWLCVRGNRENNISVDGDVLLITGTKKDLNDRDCSSLLLQRQKDFVMDYEIKFKVPKLSEGQSLGLTCYYDENSFIKYGVSYNENGYCILLQEYVGDDYRSSKMINNAMIKNDDIVSCKVKINELVRSFKLELNGVVQNEEIINDTSYLASEGLRKGKRFTGATLGMYCHGDVVGIFY